MLDPTEEITTIRRELAAKFNNDVARIGADLRERQSRSSRTYVSFPKREPIIALVASEGASQIPRSARLPSE